MLKLENKEIIGIAALLIHAAKIDEIYSDDEKTLIKKFIKSYLKDGKEEVILKEAEEIEKNSNQLLNFTNIIKKNDEETKSDIIKHLWEIIISDKTIETSWGKTCSILCELYTASYVLSSITDISVIETIISGFTSLLISRRTSFQRSVLKIFDVIYERWVGMI